MKHIWQKSFAAFAGPGIHRPSDTLRVTNDEAVELIAKLNGLAWQNPVFAGNSRHPDYQICNAEAGWNTALFFESQIVGFYADSYLWISREHRGQGLSTPLILAAAEQRGGGSIMPPNVVCQGYTPGGLLAHRSAYRAAVLAALAAMLPVPSSVLDELNLTAANATFNSQAA